jgi:hypothetical protein
MLAAQRPSSHAGESNKGERGTLAILRSPVRCSARYAAQRVGGNARAAYTGEVRGCPGANLTLKCSGVGVGSELWMTGTAAHRTSAAMIR